MKGASSLLGKCRPGIQMLKIRNNALPAVDSGEKGNGLLEGRSKSPLLVLSARVFRSFVRSHEGSGESGPAAMGWFSSWAREPASSLSQPFRLSQSSGFLLPLG